MLVGHRAFGAVSLGMFLLLWCVALHGIANPIPIEPHPETNLPNIPHGESITIGWIIAVYIIDFFLDTLLIYAGVLLLGRFNVLSPQQVFAMPKTTLFLAVFLISLVGFSAEWLLGASTLGLFLILWVVVVSFMSTSRYLFKFAWINALYLGVFAAIVNLCVWILLYAL